MNNKKKIIQLSEKGKKRFNVIVGTILLWTAVCLFSLGIVSFVLKQIGFGLLYYLLGTPPFVFGYIMTKEVRSIFTAPVRRK